MTATAWPWRSPACPEQIRGYGHVKQAHLDKVAKRQEELLAAFRAPAVRQTAAE